MNTPVVQIYTMQSVAEAVEVAELGVDHIGVTPAERGLPGEITIDTAADICHAVRGKATSVALSVEEDPASILAMVDQVNPDILHLCAPSGAVDPTTVAGIRRAAAGVAIMQAIAVTGPGAIDEAVVYAEVSDYLILDSVDPDVEGIGAAGTTHDWKVSAAIVAAVDIPVILAGGLSPENVADAVAAVQPWGVDSLTHTNRSLASGGFRKDRSRVAAFIDGVRGQTGRGEGS
jgi:phosphoribosylanthranilate isomerase